jgi:hypothetical protein
MKTLKVKVLDMTDGRVEKIEYNGDIYELIPDSYPSIYGDICLNKKATIGDWKIGMYFENTAESFGDYYLPQGGDKGVYMDDEANLNRESCDVFRKERKFKAGDIVFATSTLNEGFYKIGKDQEDYRVVVTTTGKIFSIENIRLATYNEKKKFYEEYIKISPLKAYEYYFNGKKVYYRHRGDLECRNVREQNLLPSSVKSYETEFYIKKEEKSLEKATFFNIHSNYTDLSFGKDK